MQLTTNTIEVLKNFSTINQSILFKPGKIQRTISPQKNIFGEAELTEDFPLECGIFELPKFLATLTLFDEPNLDFNGQYVDITGKDTSNSIRYFYAPSSLIIAPPTKSIVIETEIDRFTIDQDALTKLNKSALILGLPDFVVEKSDGYRIITTKNIKNKSSNTFTVKQDCDKTASYSVVLNNDNLKLIPGGYEIVVGEVKTKKIVKFETTDKKLSYIIAAEA